jgi:hypothetical protein
MSAYVVEKEVIQYIIEAAKQQDMGVGKDVLPKIFVDWKRIKDMTPEELDALGQMLWDENVRSVEYRYQESDNSDGLPGEDTSKPKEDRFYYVHGEPIFDRITLGQTMKTLHNYAYQSCETPDWETTPAFKFVMAVAWDAGTLIPGYEEAVWGAPLPNPNLVSLTALMEKRRKG